MNAAIWHDGSSNKDSKSVIKDATFVGDKGYKLGRYHRDAQIYLINCHFSKDISDARIYQATSDNVIQWGERIYYYKCTKEGKPFFWYNDNIQKSEVKKITKELLKKIENRSPKH
jgi:pectinesterase